MANKMKNFLPATGMERMRAMLELKEEYETGQFSLEEAHEMMETKIGEICPYRLVLIGQNIKSYEDDKCIRADMRKITELVEGSMDYGRPDIPEDHPLSHYYKENDEMRRLLLAAEDLVQYPVVKSQWLELYDQIRRYPIRYHHKQNQLYPLLEKKKFGRPTTTMQNLDDIAHDEVKDSLRLLEAGEDEAFIAKQGEPIAYACDLMEKEETILYPTSYALISAEEFEDIESGNQEIGFAFFKVDTPSTPDTRHSTPQKGFAEDLRALLSKYGYSTGPQRELDMTTGKLTLEQINLIYRHLPVDISSVNGNELVKLYSDTDHRIFPRSKNVIGRQVSNCHLRRSAHIVKEIVEKFRSNEQDKAEFWISKPGVFIYIVYFAARDAEGRFRGVLKMIQNYTHIRKLTGSQTLLTQAGREEKSTTNTTPSDNEGNEASVAQSNAPIEITPDARLRDLFAACPSLKKELASRYPSFKILSTSLDKLILKKATVRTASERSGLDERKSTNLLKECIKDA